MTNKPVTSDEWMQYFLLWCTVSCDLHPSTPEMVTMTGARRLLPYVEEEALQRFDFARQRAWWVKKAIEYTVRTPGPLKHRLLLRQLLARWSVLLCYQASCLPRLEVHAPGQDTSVESQALRNRRARLVKDWKVYDAFKTLEPIQTRQGQAS
jgi:hypothetical protein